MFDNLKAYFIENILIMHKEYLKIRKNQELTFSSDLRTSINLATALFHFREHFPEEIKKPKAFFANICQDYLLIGDVVNASKHSKLTHGNPEISNAKNIFERVLSTEYKDKKGIFYHIEKTVIVKLDNGSERDLHEIITNVINMWINELKSLEIIKDYPIQKYKSNRLPRRNSQSGILNLNAMIGLRFKPNFQVRKYNYEKKQIEPVDLTKAHIEMNFYKPVVHIVDISITTKENKVIDLPVEIDENELKEYLNLKTQESQIEYLFQKAKNQGLIHY